MLKLQWAGQPQALHSQDCAVCRERLIEGDMNRATLLCLTIGWLVVPGLRGEWRRTKTNIGDLWKKMGASLRTFHTAGAMAATATCSTRVSTVLAATVRRLDQYRRCPSVALPAAESCATI